MYCMTETGKKKINYVKLTSKAAVTFEGEHSGNGTTKSKTPAHVCAHMFPRKHKQNHLLLDYKITSI